MALRNILVMFAAACLDAAKVCYPYFGYVNDYGWTFVQNVARSYVDNELGTTSEYTEGVFFLSPDWPFDPTPAQEAVYETYAKDCDIILSGSNAMDPVTKKVAAKYPHIKFIIIGHIPRPTTLTNYAFTYIRAYQGKYIGGMVAASQPGVKTLGYVGSYPGPDSYQHVNAFYLGAASVNPNIKMYNINVMSWYDLEKERIAALQLIALYDCDLLSFDSDSDEVAKVAAEEGKLSVGYKGDNAIANGNSVLVSVVFDWRQVFKQLMQSALDGTWSSKYQSFEYVGFDGKAVSMGTFSTRVDSSTREKAKRIIQEFEAKNDTVYCSADGGFIDTKGIFQKPMNNGSCFSMESENSDLQQMNWLHGGITDLGPLSAHTKPDVRTCYAFFGPTSDFGWTYVQNFARNYVDVNLPGSTSEYVENVAFMNDTKQREVLDNFIDKGCHIIVLASGVLLYV
jgi:basic membrane protein A and related proteins